jgi:hypothetical protein
MFEQVFTVWIKTLNPAAGTVAPDGLNTLRIRAVSSVSDGRRMRILEAIMKSWVVINNNGNAPWPTRSRYFLEQIANIHNPGFPWVRDWGLGRRHVHLAGMEACTTMLLGLLAMHRMLPGYRGCSVILYSSNCMCLSHSTVCTATLPILYWHTVLHQASFMDPSMGTFALLRAT